MTFKSFIYKPNLQKIKEDRMSIIYLVAIILALILVFIFFLRGLLGLALLGAIAGGLIKIKLDDVRKKGANRFGSLPSIFQLSPESIKIGDTEYKIDEITVLAIDADDFVGGPGGDIFGPSTGTDNFIEFTSAGQKLEYQFIVKSRSDLKLIGQIKTEISKTQKAQS